jgi:AraC-like DNA-binding protein
MSKSRGNLRQLIKSRTRFELQVFDLQEYIITKHVINWVYRTSVLLYAMSIKRHMSALFESRLSDSPYIEVIWRGYVESDYAPICPADAHWNLLFTRYQDEIRVSVEGPTSRFTLKHHPEGAEFLVIKFKLGTTMPVSELSPGILVNADTVLPEASGDSFWLNGSAWQFPNFENVEEFVARLAREDLLVQEPLVTSVLQDQEKEVSSRTVRRRFLSSTGLTPKVIQQIARAQQAAARLEQGVPILDVTYEVGYSDQPHLTRSLKRFYGQTPAQIAMAGNP